MPDETRGQLDAIAAAENRSVSNWLDTHLWPLIDKMAENNTPQK